MAANKRIPLVGTEALTEFELRVACMTLNWVTQEEMHFPLSERELQALERVVEKMSRLIPEE